MPRFFIWTYVFFFGFWIYIGDLLAQKILVYSRRTEFIRQGSCQRTGQCCRNLAIQIPRSWAKRPKIVRLFNAWYRSIMNFHYLGTINENWLVFECHYLKNNNTCGVYPYRPKLCREFPLVPLFGHGRLHKGCGFWFLKRSEQGKFGAQLTKQAHDLERQEYLNSFE